MSRLRSAVLAVALGICNAPPAAAQSSDARVQARIVDSLVAMWRRSAIALNAYGDTANKMSFDTVRSSNIRLLVDPAVLDRGRAAAAIAAKEIDRIAGPVSAPLVNYPITLRRRNLTNTDTLVMWARTGRVSDHREQWGAVPDSTLASWIVSNAIWLLSIDLLSKDPALRRWMPQTIVPDSVNTHAWTAHRLNIVSADPSIGRRCYAGDIDACHHVLGLKGSEDPARDYYDAADRRRVVERERPWIHVRDREDADRCLAGDDEACIVVIQRRTNDRAPIGTGHRETLVRLAITMGGSGGFQRFLGTHGTPTQRLAAAAGVPVEAVVREWQRRIVEARVPSQDMTPGIAASSFLWILACGALALRSSRWR